MPDTGAQAQAVELTDDSGHTLRLARPARRIIALYGAYNEILLEMGLGDRLIARTKADAEIKTIAHLPAIGTHMRPNVELITGYAPDLVLQMGGRKGAALTVEAVRRHGIPVAVFSPVTLDELYTVISTIGALTAAQQQAQALITRMQNRIARVQQQLGDIKETQRPRIFFEVRSPALLGAGRGSVVSDVIHLAGGVNALTAEKKFVRLGEEALMGINPDVYLVQQGPMNQHPVPLKQRKRYQGLRAVQTGAVRVVDEHSYSRPGPRLALAVEELAQFLYPQRFN